MAVIITPTQVKTLESALFDLNNTEAEMQLLRDTGADVSDIEPIRADLKRNLQKYLEYARSQRKGT